MAWKDLQARFRSFFSGKTEESSRRPDGGTSCYRPVQRRNSQEEVLAREKAAEYEAAQGQVLQAHSGFTGMNPPAAGEMPYQTGLAADPYGYGAAQAAQQEFRRGYAPPQAAAGGGQAGYAQGGIPQDGYGQAGYAGSGALQTGYAPQFQTPDNISYMPGAYMPDQGSSFTHVEHIMVITGLQSCYEAIECMKNGETLIVTLDVLGSEGESIRCQDMLAGAAFTLRCTVRNLASVGVVVIAPSGVKILPEERRYERAIPYTSQPQGWSGEEQPRRERRVSQNAAGWAQAGQPGVQGYNPYTGAQPVVTEAYSAYGGY